MRRLETGWRRGASRPCCLYKQTKSTSTTSLEDKQKIRETRPPKDARKKCFLIYRSLSGCVQLPPGRSFSRVERGQTFAPKKKREKGANETIINRERSDGNIQKSLDRERTQLWARREERNEG